MTTPHTRNGNNDKQPKGGPPEIPFPKALWAALNRDPEAVTALFWALDRLVSRKRKPPLCYPGGCDCPFCHPNYGQLKTDSR